MFYITNVFRTVLIQCVHHHHLNGSWTENDNGHKSEMDNNVSIKTSETKRTSVIRNFQKPLLSKNNAGINHDALQNIKTQKTLVLNSPMIIRKRYFHETKNIVSKIKVTRCLDRLNETSAQTSEKISQIPSHRIEISKHNNEDTTRSQSGGYSIWSAPDIDKTDCQTETQTNQSLSLLKHCYNITGVDNGAINNFKKEPSKDIVLPQNKESGTATLEARPYPLQSLTNEINYLSWGRGDIPTNETCCATTIINRINETRAQMSTLLAINLRKCFPCIFNLILFHIFLTTVFIKPTLADDLLVTANHPDNLTTSTSSTTVDEVTVGMDRANVSFIPWERNICDDYYRKHQQIVTGRSTDISLNLTHPLFRTTNGIHPGVTYQGMFQQSLVNTGKMCQ
ncbi:hypothetical protein WDU94_003367 [Cyamophila willieti]